MHAPNRLPWSLAGMSLAAGLLFSVARAADPGAGSDSAAPAAPTTGVVENSVVKVFATVRYPELMRPWTKASPQEISGSGVVIDGKRILTNAHVVTYASQVQVQANQAGDKVSASVEYVAPGIDLAVLKLDDESFFDTHPALRRAAAMPAVKDPVLVYGFPTGGTNLSITKGIVSRIDFAPYRYPVSGLRIQIDAAINPGNSGGPAVVNDQMIGLAFSRLGGGAESIGYIVPGEEIDLFLRDIADGHYDGKPAMFDEFQTLENPALRAFLKVDKSVHGMVVREPHGAAPDYPLKTWDIVTKIGDTPVDDQGMIRTESNLRLRFTYLVQKLAKDGRVPLTLVRDGKELAVELPVTPDRPKLIPFLEGTYPSYFICGPMVFSVATEEYIGAMTNGATGMAVAAGLTLSSNPIMTRRGDKPAFPGEQLVVVASPFLPHKLAQGYSPPPIGQVVKTVNGIPIKNLRHLVEVIRDSKDPYLTIAFDAHGPESVVFPRTDMIAATEGILGDNGIRSQGSPDLMEVWNAKPAGGS